METVKAESLHIYWKNFIEEWIKFHCFFHWLDFECILYYLNQVCWDVIFASLKCTIFVYRLIKFDECIHSHCSYHSQDIDCFTYSQNKQI